MCVYTFTQLVEIILEEHLHIMCSRDMSLKYSLGISETRLLMCLKPHFGTERPQDTLLRFADLTDVWWFSIGSKKFYITQITLIIFETFLQNYNFFLDP